MIRELKNGKLEISKFSFFILICLIVGSFIFGINFARNVNAGVSDELSETIEIYEELIYTQCDAIKTIIKDYNSLEIELYGSRAELSYQDLLDMEC